MNNVSFKSRIRTQLQGGFTKIQSEEITSIYGDVAYFRGVKVQGLFTVYIRRKGSKIDIEDTDFSEMFFLGSMLFGGQWNRDYYKKDVNNVSAEWIRIDATEYNTSKIKAGIESAPLGKTNTTMYVAGAALLVGGIIVYKKFFKNKTAK